MGFKNEITSNNMQYENKKNLTDILKKQYK
jgi:hypothetical protein